MKNILKRKTSIVAIILILIFIIYAIYVGAGKIKRYNETLNYLTIEQGYEKGDIKSINVKHSLLNKILSYGEWTILVVFSDEPNAIYYYDYRNGIISQGGLAGNAENDIYKHVEGVEGGLDKSK